VKRGLPKHARLHASFSRACNTAPNTPSRQPSGQPSKQQPQPIEYGQAIETCHLPPNAVTASSATNAAVIPLDLTDFKRDLSELTDRLGQAQDCL
jgi:peptide chain release factor 2